MALLRNDTRQRYWPLLTCLVTLALLLPAAIAAPNPAAFKVCINTYIRTSKSRMTLAFGDANTRLYQSLSQRIFNTRFWWQKPLVVALPKSNQDVSNLMKCASKASIKYVARCGGHNYEGLSSINKGLVIDLASLNAITVNKQSKTAVIGAGQRLGLVYRTLFESGGFMIPGGTCIAVGVSGLTSGGGIGASTRKLGLTIDWLQSATVVTPAGTILTASATSNADLFFAIRGGAGNFGIVTSWTFRLSPVPQQVTVLEVMWQGWQAKDVLKAIMAWKAWSLPPEYSNVEWFWGTDSISTSIYFWGPKTTVERILQTGPFKAAPSFTIKYFSQLSYQDFVLHYTNFAGEPGWTFQNIFTAETIVSRQWGPKTVKDAAATSFKGASVMLDKDLSADAVDALAKAKSTSRAGWVQARALRGAAARVAANATAYPHRKAVWEVQVYTGVQGDADLQWVQRTKAALRPYSSGYEYVNYIDCGSTKDPWRTYFAGNAARLKAIKKKYDPTNQLDALSCHKQ